MNLALTNFNISKSNGENPDIAYGKYLLALTTEEDKKDIAKLLYNDTRIYKVVNITLNTYENIITNMRINKLQFNMDKLCPVGKNIISNISIFDVYKIVIPLSEINLYTKTIIDKDDYITICLEEFVGCEYFQYGNMPKFHFHGICKSYNAETNICEIAPYLSNSFVIEFTFPVNISRLDNLTFTFYNNHEKIEFESEYIDGQLSYNTTGTVSCNFTHNLSTSDKVAIINFKPYVAEFTKYKYYTVSNLTSTTFDIGVNLSSMPISTNPNRPCVNLQTRTYDLTLNRISSRVFRSNNEHFLNVGDKIVFNNLQNRLVNHSQNNDGIFTVISVDSDFVFSIDMLQIVIPNINNSGFIANITAYQTSNSENRKSNLLTFHVKKRRHFIPLNMFISAKKTITLL